MYRFKTSTKKNINKPNHKYWSSEAKAIFYVVSSFAKNRRLTSKF